MNAQRRALVLVHRYVGLVMAGFLVIAGLTGALLVWYHELDAAINPRLLRVVAPAQGSGGEAASPLSPLDLRDRVQAAYPNAWVHWVPLRAEHPSEAHVFWIEGASDAEGRHADLGVDEVFVDPYTGAILGARKWGDLDEGSVNLMPFMYRLHESLALGTVGTWVFGVIALLWTVDCFIGAYLTFPQRSRSRRRNWWVRWKPAWLLRWHASGYKLNFDLHRAGGLWPWALLLVLAWSSVAFNLYDPVYRPVMGMFFETRPDPRAGIPRLRADLPEPPLGWPAGLAAARERLAEVAAARGVRILYEERLAYDPHRGYLRLVIRTDRDINERRSRSSIFVDGTSGALLAVELPTGEATGDTITAWLTTLHMAHIWGLPFRILVTLAGLVIVLLSVTGVVIWWRKRGAEARAGYRMAPAPVRTR